MPFLRMWHGPSHTWGLEAGLVVGSPLLRDVHGETQPGCLELPFGRFAVASEGFSSGLTAAPGSLSGSESPRMPCTN